MKTITVIALFIAGIFELYASMLPVGGGGGGGGDALTTNPLSQFASTTSAQLAGVLSNETGTGVAVFSISPALTTPDLGTPSALVGTNITGTGASFTSGNATKWTAGRTIALTGDVTYTSGSLDGSGNVTGTATLANIPAIAGTNLTGTGASFTAGNATKWTTGRTVATTGDVTYTSGSLDGSGNVTGTATLANVPVTATFATSNTTLPTNTGGWTEYFVTTSDAATTGQVLVDITGLVTGTLSNSTLYEFEARIFATTSAVATGISYGIHGAGTGTAATCEALMTATTTTNGATNATIAAVDTASSAVVTTISENGMIFIHGFFTSTSTGAATMSLQHLKVTSGTATAKVGSVLRIRKAHT